MTEIINEFDIQKVEKLMDRTKAKVFLGPSSAFYGSILCGLNFIWVTDIDSACTNGLSIQWNPEHFLNLPEDTRITVLMHEIKHVAYLHVLRRGDRHPEVWNWACDVVINNELVHDGYSFDGSYPWMDDNINRWKHPTGFPIGNYGSAPAEEVYEALMALSVIQDMIKPIDKINDPDNLPGWLQPTKDMVYPEGEPDEVQDQASQIINKVVQASHTANLTTTEGTPVSVSELLNRFLQPKVPWEVHIQHWMHDLLEENHTWARPNRRYMDMYLPSMQEDEGRLDHLLWFFDVSGSVTQVQVIRMMSEVKYIKDTFNPKRLTIVLFDDCIQKEIVITEHEEFNDIEIQGRGGTYLGPVRRYIMEAQPKATAAIIFSDMCCAPMEKLPADKEIPILWIGVNATRSHQINEGKIIYISE